MACVAVNRFEFESEPDVRSGADRTRARSALDVRARETADAAAADADRRATIDALLHEAGLRFVADARKARARVGALGELVPDGTGGFVDPTREVELVLDAWDQRHRVGYEVLGAELGRGHDVRRLAAGPNGRDGELLTWYRGQVSVEGKPARHRGVVALFDVDSKEDLRTQVLQFAAWLHDNGLGQ